MSFAYVRVETLIEIARDLGVAHVRDLGLLQSAAQRPEMQLFGADVYPTIEIKAAAFVESLVRNHALIDGNKRLGWIGLCLFLDLNEQRLFADHSEGYDFIVGIASGELEFEEIISWIAERLPE